MVDFTKADGFVLDDQGRRQYADRDDAALIPGTEISAGDHNEVRNELVELVARAGLTPSNDDLTQVYQAVQKLVAAGASAIAVGFTPVEQGGHDGLNADKINIGNATGGLSVYVAGQLWGVFASQAWAGTVFATISGLNAETQRATTIESNLQTSVGQKVNRAGDIMTGYLFAANNAPSMQPGQWNYSPALRSYTNTRVGFKLFAQDQVNSSAAGVLVYDWAGTDQQYWWFNSDGSLSQSTKGLVAWQADLPLPVGQHIQIFHVTIPKGTVAGVGNNPFVASLPQAFANFLSATGCDTGSTVYTVAATPNGNSRVSIWVTTPGAPSGPLTGDVVITITACGYF